jgi:DTW domain-containing protein YfiP
MQVAPRFVRGEHAELDILDEVEELAEAGIGVQRVFHVVNSGPWIVLPDRQAPYRIPRLPSSAAMSSPRFTCARCLRPSTTCLCALATPVANTIDVLVLQHPRELREAKGSVRLLALSLARCRVEVGEVFESDVLHELLQGGGRRSVLLYPEATGGVVVAEARDGAAPAPGERPTQLVAIDATWRKSLRVLKSNPLLEALPRLSLRPAMPSAYTALRKARRPGQLSTLEAVCGALGELEAAPQRYAPLVGAFERFVAAAVARRSPGAGGG